MKTFKERYKDYIDNIEIDEIKKEELKQKIKLMPTSEERCFRKVSPSLIIGVFVLFFSLIIFSTELVVRINQESNGGGIILNCKITSDSIDSLDFNGKTYFCNKVDNEKFYESFNTKLSSELTVTIDNKDSSLIVYSLNNYNENNTFGMVQKELNSSNVNYYILYQKKDSYTGEELLESIFGNNYIKSIEYLNLKTGNVGYIEPSNVNNFIETLSSISILNAFENLESISDFSLVYHKILLENWISLKLSVVEINGKKEIIFYDIHQIVVISDELYEKLINIK